MKTRNLVLLLFAFSYCLGFGKNYNLTYKPTGKIIQLAFDSCILFTDSSSYFLVSKSNMQLLYKDAPDEINAYYKRIRTFFKTKDTLKIDLTNYSGGSDTLNSPFDFIKTAFNLVEINRAKLFSVRAKAFVTHAKITIIKKRRYSWKKFFLLDKETAFVLLYYIYRPYTICF